MLTVLASIWANGSILRPDWREYQDGNRPAAAIDKAKDKYENYQGLKSHVPIANNTWIHQDQEGNHHIRYHNTDIMSFSPNGDTTINADGWGSSPSTAQRMHAFMPEGVSLGSDGRRRTRANPEGSRRWLTLSNGEKHEYHDGISFNHHTNEMLPDDHVRPTGGPVMPPRARGRGDTSTPIDRPSGDWRAPAPRPTYYNPQSPNPGNRADPTGRTPQQPYMRGDSSHGDEYPPDRHSPLCPYPNANCTCGAGNFSRPTFPRGLYDHGEPGANYNPERDRQEIRNQESQRPGSDAYDSSSTWTPPKHEVGGDEGPREGESFADWMDRTTPASTAIKCKRCQGKGQIYSGAEQKRQDCPSCKGTGSIGGTTASLDRAKYLTEADLEVLSLRYMAGLRRLAFGETVAPTDVDTLRDEECPVCGESSSSFDGQTCQVCGFDAPPVMFRDPDLEKAKSLDLRKDEANEGLGNLPGRDGLTPDEQDDNGGMPGEVPGSGVPGSDQMPVDPSMLDEEGQPLPGAEPAQQVDPAQILQQQMDQLQSGVPLTPDMLGPDGEIVPPDEDPLDPEQVDEEGNPIPPEGQEVPGVPGEPEPGEQIPGEPVDPSALDEEGNQVAPDGQEEVPEPGAGDPGTPEDGAADLVCPACGFSTDAAQPTSTSMDDQAIPQEGESDGTMVGDVCPNCGKALMVSVGEMEEQQGAAAAQPGVPV
jgi:rRNA maturation protein Nop10